MHNISPLNYYFFKINKKEKVNRNEKDNINNWNSFVLFNYYGEHKPFQNKCYLVYHLLILSKLLPFLLFRSFFFNQHCSNEAYFCWSTAYFVVDSITKFHEGTFHLPLMTSFLFEEAFKLCKWIQRKSW